MKKALGILIQARTGSTRLPGKILMDIDGEPLILSLYNRIKSHYDLPCVVATTRNAKDNYLAEILTKNDIKLYRGEEENVLQRFIDASQAFEFSDIIRVCADNPLLDFEYLDKLIAKWEDNDDDDYDYISFEFHNKPVILSHFGIFAEIVRVSALKKLAILFPDNYIYKEHVTNGIYLNPEIFRICLLNIDDQLNPFEGIRLTVDTNEDFKRVSELIKKSGKIKFGKIADYILTQPEMLKEMKEAISRNSK